MKMSELDSNVEEAIENMRNDVIDFRNVIEGSSYSTDNDYYIIKQALSDKDNKLNAIEEVINKYGTANGKMASTIRQILKENKDEKI